MKIKVVTIITIFLASILTMRFNIGPTSLVSGKLSVEAYTRTNAAADGNLLVNGGFEDGLIGWNLATPTGSYSYNVISDGEDYPNALDYRRWNSGNDGSTCGVGQELDILVQSYRELYVELDVKVIDNTLHDSGWWSDVYGGNGEWPALVRIKFEDVDGTEWIWEHGFFPDDDNEFYGRTNFEYVVRNQWYQYVSPNLVNVTTTKTAPHNEPIESPKPYRLTHIFVGGTGWDVGGLLDDVTLWGIPRDHPTTILIEPHYMTVTPCEEFTVNVNIADVVDLVGWEVKISFDPTFVECINVVEGPFLQSAGPTNFTIAEINNGIGYAWFGCILIWVPPVIGSGTLATVTFHCLGEGDVDLHLYDTILIDDTQTLIPHDTVDGVVSQLSSRLLPTVSLFPHEIYLDEQTSNFTVSVNIENLQASHRFVGIGLQLEYDTTVLSFVEMIEGEFLKDFEKDVVFANETDFLIIGILLKPPWTRFPEGNGTLVAFSFTVSVLLNSTMYISGHFSDADANANQLQNNYCHIRSTWNGADLNHDGKVNVLDLSVFAEAFATCPGQYRWNTNVDIDRNHVINIIDATVVAKNFGK